MKLDKLCRRDYTVYTYMMYVQVKKDFCAATDAMVMGVIPTDSIFKQSFIDKIPEDGIYIHFTDWKLLRKKFDFAEWRTESIIEITYTSFKKRPRLIEVLTSDQIEKYPEWRPVFDVSSEPKSEVRLNPSILKRLCDALDFRGPILEFSEGYKPIKVTAINHSDGRAGMLMPIVLP